MVIALFTVPTVVGLVLFCLRDMKKTRHTLLLTTALFHLLVTISFWLKLPEPLFGGVLRLDELGRLFLTIISILFATSAIYTCGYLSQSLKTQTYNEADEHGSHTTFLGSLVLFLAAMTLVTFCQNIELLWVAIETTTLASTPLIYFNRNPEAVAATWKYFMICSVGIGLALLGNFFLAVSLAHLHVAATSLQLEEFIMKARELHTPWLKAGFLLLFIGYGTKLGLAPFHSWLPDAYAEAPVFVSTLLSGALSNCALLGILRIYQICCAAGLHDFAALHFQIFGMLSLTFAAASLLRQNDYKYLLAFSSVEHIGIISLGIGLGGGAIWGSMLHTINSSITKAMLFLIAGNIFAVYGTRGVKAVNNLSRRMPFSGSLWLIGLFALSGIPPFGMFFSKFMILKTAVSLDHPILASVILLLIVSIFLGMAMVVTRMYHGKEAKAYDPNTVIEIAAEPAAITEPLWSKVPILILLLLILILGIYIPKPLADSLTNISTMLGEGVR